MALFQELQSICIAKHDATKPVAIQPLVRAKVLQVFDKVTRKQLLNAAHAAKKGESTVLNVSYTFAMPKALIPTHDASSFQHTLHAVAEQLSLEQGISITVNSDDAHAVVTIAATAFITTKTK